MTRMAEWRSLGRPGAALIGVQYRANDEVSAALAAFLNESWTIPRRGLARACRLVP